MTQFLLQETVQLGLRNLKSILAFYFLKRHTEFLIVLITTYCRPEGNDDSLVVVTNSETSSTRDRRIVVEKITIKIHVFQKSPVVEALFHISAAITFPSYAP